MSPKCIPKELIEFSTISNGSTHYTTFSTASVI